MSDFDAVDGSPQRHRDVPIRDSDGPTASYILAFAERLVLAEGVEKLTSIATRLGFRIAGGYRR